MGKSAFNLAIWQERLVDESWVIDPCEGPVGRVTATRGRMTSIVWKPCNLLTDVNHLVKVIVLVNRAVWQDCRFPHYRLSMYREGWKKPYEHFARFI